MGKNDLIEAAKHYLLTQVHGGVCPAFFQLRHGPSRAWTTACIGSTLAEFSAVPTEMLGEVLSWQAKCGGWSYNQAVPPDADTTLRVLQFLSKVGYTDPAVVNKAEHFVSAHQQADGGIATYLPEIVRSIGYPEGGWTVSHPCVTALATRIVRNKRVRRDAQAYMERRLVQGDARSYWWKTPWYVRYESGRLNGEEIGNDPVEIGLVLLLKAYLHLSDRVLLSRLKGMQLADGSFPGSNLFRIPRPAQFLEDINGTEKTVADTTRLFSTAAAVIAISRQEQLIQ